MFSKLDFSLIKYNFLKWPGLPYLSLLIWIFPLLLLGISNNSLMAHDEGLYAWRSRLMYDSGDYINPWGTPHHKTPGFYWLITIFYRLFGIGEISVRLPSMLAGILSILLVYEIGRIILNKNLGWLAAAILSVEFLWLQYSRLGTPDVPMVFLVLLGIWSLLKAELNPKHRYFWGFITGISFSIGFFLRSFMICLPIVALFPYLILQHRRHNHLTNPLLYLGLLLGLTPSIVWLRLSSLRFGSDSFAELINFVTKLSSSERRNNNWIYYFWNVTIIAFPWSFFSLLGGSLLMKKLYSNHDFVLHKSILNQSKKIFKYSQYISLLIGFPVIFFIEISIFSTRLSHYSLVLYPFIALLSAVGLSWLGKIWNQETEEFKLQNIKLFSKLNPSYLSLSSTQILQTLNYTFGGIGILLLLTGTIIFFISDDNGEIRNYAITGLVLGWGWLTLPLIWIARCRFGKSLITARYWIGVWLISAWLSLSAASSLGLLSNYNPDFQAFLQKPEISQVLQNHPINFVDVGGKTGVLINFYTPKHGKKVNQILKITSPSYIWIRQIQAAQISQPHHVIGEVQKYQLIKLE